MKKVFALLFVPLFAFVLFACGSVPTDPATSSTTPDLSNPPAVSTPDSNDPSAQPKRFDPELSDFPPPPNLPEVDSSTAPSTDPNRAGHSLKAQAFVFSWVDPSSGSDSNDGSFRKPFKTIKNAIAKAIPGQKINLNRGTYSAATGETFGYTVPEGVVIDGSSGVILDGKANQYAFNFQGSGRLQNMTLFNFGVPIFATGKTKGVITLWGLNVRNRYKDSSGYAIYDTSPSELRVINSQFVGRFSVFIYASGTSTNRPKLLVSNVSMDGYGPGNPKIGILAKYADLTIDGLSNDFIGGNVVRMGNRTTASITSSKFIISRTGTGCIASDGQNVLKVRTSTFVCDTGHGAISVFGNWYLIDLGTSTSDPGRNSMNESGGLGLEVHAPDYVPVFQTYWIHAVGNTWQPNHQGSDANGHYNNVNAAVSKGGSITKFTPAPVGGWNYNLYSAFVTNRQLKLGIFNQLILRL